MLIDFPRFSAILSLCVHISCDRLFVVKVIDSRAMSLLNLNLNLNTDRTVNRIAVCSAVIAGFAYVGYSVCRNAFTGRRSRRKDEEGSHSILLRRLSQTTQTDALLGDLVFDGSQRILLRPKSVQERIRELNMQARQFASAVSAIQQNRSSARSYKGGRSLQVLLQSVYFFLNFYHSFSLGNSMEFTKDIKSC